MGTCKTCKHWDTKPHGDWGDQKTFGLRKCLFITRFFNATKWNDDGDQEFRHEFKDHQAFVDDGDGYRATLATKEDFGCASYEAYSEGISTDLPTLLCK